MCGHPCTCLAVGALSCAPPAATATFPYAAAPGGRGTPTMALRELYTPSALASKNFISPRLLAVTIMTRRCASGNWSAGLALATVADLQIWVTVTMSPGSWADEGAGVSCVRAWEPGGKGGGGSPGNGATHVETTRRTSCDLFCIR